MFGLTEYQEDNGKKSYGLVDRKTGKRLGTKFKFVWNRKSSIKRVIRQMLSKNYYYIMNPGNERFYYRDVLGDGSSNYYSYAELIEIFKSKEFYVVDIRGVNETTFFYDGDVYTFKNFESILEFVLDNILEVVEL